LVGDLLELRSDLACRLDLDTGIDDDHAVVTDHHDGVADRPADSHVDVVADLVDLSLEDRSVRLQVRMDSWCDCELFWPRRNSRRWRRHRSPGMLAAAAAAKERTCHAGGAVVQEATAIQHRACPPVDECVHVLTHYNLR